MEIRSIDAEAVVQRQLDAYNARDIEGFMATYADDAELFEHPSKLLTTGAAQLRERFLARFREPNLHARIAQRMVMGDLVVDHEKLDRTFPEGRGKMELVTIYRVREGKIANVWFIFGPRSLDPEA